MHTRCEREANTQTLASGKKNPQRGVWCTESGLSAAREEIPHLDKSVSWAVSRREAEESGRAAWLLTCCKVLIRRWTSVGPMESTRGAGSVRWRLSTPASTHHSALCLVSKHTHSHTNTGSDQIITSKTEATACLVCLHTEKSLRSLLRWSRERASWAQCATGRCSRLICANQSRLCWATSPCDPDWLTQGCN